MKNFTLLLFILQVFIVAETTAQCTTTNATSCVCLTPGSTNCDLLPDIIVGKPPLLVAGNNGVIEYSQTGNGAENGRLRVSVTTPNIGRGPLEVRTTNTYICGTDTITGTAPATCPNSGLPPRQLVKQRVFQKSGNTMNFYDRDAGSMTYHPTHGHMHVDDWGIYTLRTSNGDPNPLNWPIIGTGAKLAFCLMDYGSCSTYSGHCVDSLGNTLNNGNFPNYGLGGGQYNCSASVQGISSGYTDIYYQYLDGMYITIPPGTCNGNYFIVVHIDPYDYFLEENENNNVIVVPYTLTQQVSSATATITSNVSGPICSSSSATLSANNGTGYTFLWSNGATTQNITVSTPGSYVVTVTTPCGTGTSSPYNLTFADIPPVTTSASVCGQGSANLSANAGGGIINWFAGPSGGNSLHTGNIYPTPVVNTTTTYYAQATTTTPGFNAHSQPNANTIGGGGYFTGSQYQIFNALQNFTLASVKVYAQSATSTTVELRSSTGTLINSMVANLPSGQSLINLNWNIPAGSNYRLTRSGSAALYRNNAGVSYPYIVPGYLSITGSSGGSGFYYFFYDWEVDVASTICVSNRIPSTVTVNPLPVVTLSPYAPVCIDATPFALTGGSPSGGSYSGPGVSNGIFDPSVAGAGTHVISYEYTNGNNCSNSTTSSITVYALPVVTLTPYTSVCIDAAPFALTGGMPSGGTYSGAGVSNGIFDPAVAGVGAHVITYEYTNGNNCTNSTTSSITVYALPVVTLAPYSSVCSNAAPIILSGGLPSGGTYSGAGVTNGSFNPAAAGVGTHIINYEYTDGNGCTASASSSIEVTNCGCVPPLMPNTISGPNTLCANTPTTYSVINVASVSSYTWALPAGLTFVSGQGTNSIEVVSDFAFNTGTISVFGNNACGAGPARTKVVSKTSATIPGSILGEKYGLCTSVTLSVNPVAGAVSYNWVLPGGSTNVTGQGTNVITFTIPPGFASGQVCVTSSTLCGSSQSRCVTIYSAPIRPAAISGDNAACAGDTKPYSVNPSFGATTYNWTVPPGSSIVSGQGTTSVNVLFGATTGFVRCVAINACGNRGAVALNINISCRQTGFVGDDAIDIFVNPNPTSENAVITLPGALDSQVTVKISNILGKVIFVENYNFTKDGSIPLELNGYSKGMYFVTVNNNNFQKTTRLIVE